MAHVAGHKRSAAIGGTPDTEQPAAQRRRLDEEAAAAHDVLAHLPPHVRDALHASHARSQMAERVVPAARKAKAAAVEDDPRDASYGDTDAAADADAEADDDDEELDSDEEEEAEPVAGMEVGKQLMTEFVRITTTLRATTLPPTAAAAVADADKAMKTGRVDLRTLLESDGDTIRCIPDAERAAANAALEAEGLPLLPPFVRLQMTTKTPTNVPAADVGAAVTALDDAVLDDTRSRMLASAKKRHLLPVSWIDVVREALLDAVRAAVVVSRPLLKLTTACEKGVAKDSVAPLPPDGIDAARTLHEAAVRIKVLRAPLTAQRKMLKTSLAAAEAELRAWMLERGIRKHPLTVRARMATGDVAAAAGDPGAPEPPREKYRLQLRTAPPRQAPVGMKDLVTYVDDWLAHLNAGGALSRAKSSRDVLAALGAAPAARAATAAKLQAMLEARPAIATPRVVLARVRPPREPGGAPVYEDVTPTYDDPEENDDDSAGEDPSPAV